MSSTPPVSQTAQDLHREAFVVDLHNDLLLTTRFTGWRWRKRHRRNPLPNAAIMGHTDLPRLEEGGVDCVCLGVVTGPRPLGGPKAAQWAIDRMHREATLAPHRLVVTRTAAGLRQAKAEGRIACMAGIEGAHCLDDGDPSPLARWRDQGAVYLGLVHFHGGSVGHAQSPRGTEQERGLTPWGLELVHEAGRVGLMIDVAHLNPGGLRQVCEESDLPVLCSHGCMDGVHPHWRAIDDQQALAVARTGGLVGIIFAANYLGGYTLETVVAHLSHLRSVVGAQHCAIGSDWEGWVRYPQGLEGADGLPRLTEALLRAGWPEQDVVATLGGNFLRVLEALGD